MRRIRSRLVFPLLKFSIESKAKTTPYRLLLSTVSCCYGNVTLDV